MMRLFVSNILQENSRVTPSSEDCHYILQVLRMREGEALDIVDGEGNVYHAAVSDIDKKICTLEVTGVQECSHEPQVRVTLYQSVSKGERMDLTIQKAVELGASRIVPVISERCVVRLDGKSGKSDRWQKIALEAARQSGRDIVPVVEEPVRFSDAIRNASESLKLIPWEDESACTLKDAIGGAAADTIAVFIGPEGGYAAAEVELARENGIKAVTLGPRILRTETAGPAVLAMIMYEMEM